MPKQRLNWLDISKGIAILATIVGHVHLLNWHPVIKIIFSFHMPLFFVAAGYTSKPVLDRASFSKLFKRIFVPYLALGVCACIYYLLHGSSFTTEAMRLFWGAGVPATYGPGRPIFLENQYFSIGMIWFFPCLFFAKILFSAFLKWTQNWKEWMRAPIILGIGICGYIIGQHYKLPLGMDISLFTLLFMYAGYLFKTYRVMEKPSVTAGFFGAFLWYLALKSNAIELSARFYRSFPACIFSCIGAIAASYCIFQISKELLDKIKGVNSFLTFCGKHSMTIFCIHYLEGKFITWTPLEAKFKAIPVMPSILPGLLFGLFKIAFCVAICFLYVFLKKKVQAYLAERKAKKKA